MAGNPTVWFEIYVQDMATARKFYESVLKVTLTKLDSGDLDLWAFPVVMDQYGAPGALVRMAGVPSGGNSTLVYFGCADCGVEAGRVVAAGGQLHKEKTAIGQFGFIALALDPDGNMFGLHSMA